jgi:RNA polymerase sigma-70 factor (ECF subfamily)
MHDWLYRLRDGDLEACDELLRSVQGRLESLARRMLKGYPVVARWEQTGDVLVGALLRLLRSLEEVTPESMRRFWGLAAEHLRRELLDLARHHRRRGGFAANHATPARGADPAPDPPAPEEADLDWWCAFHQGVTDLPDREREVVGLIFYQGWPQQQVADLLGVSVRTVQGDWARALATLRHFCREQQGED